LNWPEDYINRIICGDCLEVMKEMPNGCVDMVLTSPPYDNLRDYNGYNFDFKNIARELFRILKEGAIIAWVIGDATIDGSETGTSFKQVLYFKEIGFNLHDTMIYAKENYLPQQIINKRYANAFEYMFILVKGKPKTFNPFYKKSIWGGISKSGTFRRKNGRLEGKYVIINEEHIFPNIWTYQTGKEKSTKDTIAHEHPAIFPDKLAEDHILSWSNEDNIVMDPMCGSGTTCKMARSIKRNFIGIEINSDYCKIAEKRLAQGVL